MKTIAKWSSRNPWTARIIIALSHVALIVLGISSGIMFYVDGFEVPGGVIILMLVIFFPAYFLYPKRTATTGLFKYSFQRRCRHDFLLVMSSTCVLIAGINQELWRPEKTQAENYQVRLMVFQKDVDAAHLTKKEARKDLVQMIRSWKTNMKDQVKAYKASAKEPGTKSTGAKVALTLLAVLLALGLWIGIASLSCSISCGGNEGLAIVVLVAGTALVIWILVVAIKAIYKKPKNQSKPTDPLAPPVS